MDPGAVERQKSEIWRLLESLDIPRQVRRGQLYLSASQRQFLVDVDKLCLNVVYIDIWSPFFDST